MLKRFGFVPPLHWIATHRTGATIVIEPGKQGLVVHDNPVGVMANSPDFGWRMTNIRNYIGIRPHQLSPIEIGDVTFTPFGQASGTFGIPRDYTSPSRFLCVLVKDATNQADERIRGRVELCFPGAYRIE